MAGAKWTVDETIAPIGAYSEKMVQETIEGIASNKELHEQLQQIMMSRIMSTEHRNKLKQNLGHHGV